MNLIVEIIIISLCVLGGLAIIAIAAFAIAFAWKYFLRRRVNVKERYGGDGWVVITGGSRGLGLALAKEFHVSDMKVLLVGKDAANLEKAKAEVQQATEDKKPNTGALVEVAQFDFASPNVELRLPALVDKINALNGGISVLVNNAGGLYVGKFEEESTQNIQELITLNSTSVILLTRLLLPTLAKTAETKKTGIINVSSLLGELPTGGYTTYNATKAFVDLFTMSLAEEYWGKIDILSLKPSFIKTDMTKTEDPKDQDHWYFCTPEQVAQGTFKHIGKSDETYGHWKHGCYCWYKKIMPTCGKGKDFKKMVEAQKAKSTQSNQPAQQSTAQQSTPQQA